MTNGTWSRWVLSVDEGTLRSTYVDQGLIGNHNAGSIDNIRWSLASAFDLFSDNGGGEEQAVHVSNVALYDTALTGPEITALGPVGTVLGVPEPSTLALAALGMLGLALFARRRK